MKPMLIFTLTLLSFFFANFAHAGGASGNPRRPVAMTAQEVNQSIRYLETQVKSWCDDARNWQENCGGLFFGYKQTLDGAKKELAGAKKLEGGSVEVAANSYLYSALLEDRKSRAALKGAKGEDGLVDSPFSSCRDVAIVEDNEWEKNLSYWQDMQENCKTEHQLDLQFKPVTGLLVTSVQGLGMAEKVAQKVYDKLSANIKSMEEYRHCFQNVDEKCRKWIDSHKTALEQHRKSYRISAALSHVGSDGRMYEDMVGRNLVSISGGRELSEKSKPFFYIQDTKWKGLSYVEPQGLYALEKDEVDFARAEVNKFNVEVDKEIEGKLSSADGRRELLKKLRVAEKLKFGLTDAVVTQVSDTNTEALKRAYRNSRFYDFREDHYKNEIFSVSSAPLLLQLGMKSPSDKDVLTAYQKVLENAMEERQKVRKILDDRSLALTSGAGDKGKRDDDLTWVVSRYRGEVDEYLKDNKKDCAVAQAMLDSSGNSMIAWNVGKMVGSVALTAGGCFFVPGLGCAVGAGLVPTAAFNPEDYGRLHNTVKGMQTGTGIESQSVVRAEEVYENDSIAYATHLATPINFAFVGLGKQGSSLARSAYYAVGDKHPYRDLAIQNGKELMKEAKASGNKLTRAQFRARQDAFLKDVDKTVKEKLAEFGYKGQLGARESKAIGDYFAQAERLGLIREGKDESQAARAFSNESFRKIAALLGEPHGVQRLAMVTAGMEQLAKQVEAIKHNPQLLAAWEKNSSNPQHLFFELFDTGARIGMRPEDLAKKIVGELDKNGQITGAAWGEASIGGLIKVMNEAAMELAKKGGLQSPAVVKSAFVEAFKRVDRRTQEDLLRASTIEKDPGATQAQMAEAAALRREAEERAVNSTTCMRF